MRTELKEKLEKIVELVDKAMIDPDIDIEYCIPDVETSVKDCDIRGVPYILVKYSEDSYTSRKVRLTERYLKNSPQEIANLVTFSIEQFKSEIDAVKMGE